MYSGIDRQRSRLGFAAFRSKNIFDDSLNFAIENDLNMVQFSLDSSGNFPENILSADRDKINLDYSEKDISLCFHGPTDIPLLNRHKEIRDAGINRYKSMLDLAIEMGGEYFIIHPGRLAFYSPAKQEIVFMERALPRKHVAFFYYALKELLEFAGGRIIICLENTHSIPPQFEEVIVSLIRENNLRLVWDIGHSELLNGKYKSTLFNFFQENIKAVDLFHLHDITDKGDHKELGTGRVNIPAYVEIINTVGADVILEIFPEQAVINSIKYLLSIVKTRKAN